MIIFLLLIAVFSLVAITYWAFWVALAVGIWYALIHLSPILYVKAHPLKVLGYVAGYFLIGAVWSVIKWWSEEVEKVRKAKMYRGEKWRDEKSNVAYHKNDIYCWIAFWPFSILYDAFNEWVRKLVRRIYEELNKVYQRITDHLWS